MHVYVGIENGTRCEAITEDFELSLIKVHACEYFSRENPTANKKFRFPSQPSYLEATEWNLFLSVR